jgi:FO synthase
MRRALRRAEDGRSLRADEAIELLSAHTGELDLLSQIAGRVRDAGLSDAGRAATITYSPKVFIPLTHLCRDSCHYCTFAKSPAQLREQGIAPYLEITEVCEIAKSGAGKGALEALFTLGDQPELRWPIARAWLSERGFENTLEYLRACAIAVLEHTGLLPHLNPGVMSWDFLLRAKSVAPSVGLMLENVSERLFVQPRGAHHGSPDKSPAVRLRTLVDAGRLAIPTTTGLLVGIGETDEELYQSIIAMRDLSATYGHIQEVIIQNFRAKPDTAMRESTDCSNERHVAAVAVTRLLMGPGMRVQVPPNLSDPQQLKALVRAGADDLGGISAVTIDHVNPERPWPRVQALETLLDELQLRLRPRLTVHPEYVIKGEPWVDSHLTKFIRPLSDAETGLARATVEPQGMPWQLEAGYENFAEAHAGGRSDLGVSIDTTGRHSQVRADMTDAFGNWDSVQVAAKRLQTSAEVLGSHVKQALRLAEKAPAALADAAHESLAMALMTCEGGALDQLCRIADELRAQTCGDAVTYVVNRNINFTNVCYTGCRFCAFAQRRDDVDSFTLNLAQIGDRVAEAWRLGATEVCLQGGLHPDLPGSGYFDIAKEVKRRAPDIHLHAFSPMEVVYGASKLGVSIREWLLEAKACGLDSIPGTAAEILDDEIRWVLTKGKLPTSSWLEVVTTAHSLGLKSTATMMYGHVDQPIHWLRHMSLLRRTQESSGGFTEFVPLPFIHTNSPIYLAGVARPGPTWRDNRAVHAMARLVFAGAIDHIQASWVKLGDKQVLSLLNGGVDDLGGTLMEETISRMAGSAHGSSRSVASLEDIVCRADRVPRMRSTLYGDPAPRQQERAYATGGVLPPGEPVLALTAATKRISASIIS